MTVAAHNTNGATNGHPGQVDEPVQAFVDGNVAISPNAPEEVPTLLKRLALHGEAYLTESDENERTKILDTARSLVYALETPREAIIRHCWSQVYLTAFVTIITNRTRARSTQPSRPASTWASSRSSRRMTSQRRPPTWLPQQAPIPPCSVGSRPPPLPR